MTDARRDKEGWDSGLTVLIPVYNEERAIGQVADELTAQARNLERAVQVLVIDDGSSDQTAARAEAVDGIRVLAHHGNRGYGAALKTGVQHAEHDLVLILDGDGTYSPADLQSLLDTYVRGEADMVIGARVGSEASIPWLRRPAKWAINRLASYVAGERIPDVNSGMRIFPVSLAKQFMPLLPDGFSFTTTLTLAFLTHGYLVDYVTIEYAERKGRSKIRPIADTLGFIQLIMRLALFFAPLKVFLPLATGLLALAAAWAAATWYLFGRMADASTAVIAMASVQVAVLGLLAELINARLPRQDDLPSRQRSPRE